MNEEPTGKASTNEPTTDWERLRRMSDADMHAAVASDPEIIPTDGDFWGTAKMVLPQCKPTIIIRLDAREEAIADSEKRSPIMD
jgi:hypothetical protein